jgi:hypothetical protein
MQLMEGVCGKITKEHYRPGGLLPIGCITFFSLCESIAVKFPIPVDD